MKLSLSILIYSLFFFACNTNHENKTETGKRIPINDSSRYMNETNRVNPFAPVDVSPMDMSYYPADYPKLKMTNSITEPPKARVIYSRPHLQGRKLFTDLLKYKEPWRLGANEATELDLYVDATIQGKKMKAGRYILYCIPDVDKWTIVLNSNIDSWGLHADETKDVARFAVPSRQTTNSIEYFTIVFEKSGNNAELVIAWDNLETRLPISF